MTAVLGAATVGPPSTARITQTGDTDLQVPVYGLTGLDLTTITVDLALISDDGSEPATGAWVAAAWTTSPYPGQPSAQGATLLITAGQYQPVNGMLWVRLTHTATSEQLVLQSGRIRVGDGSAEVVPGAAPTAVISVNGKTGVVVLAASDVGADASGAAAAAQATAETYAASAAGTAQTNAETYAAAQAASAQSAAETYAASQAGTAQSAAETYASGLVATETSRAETAEGLAALKANNLSDLPSASTARTNLGLGSAATQNSGAFDASGAAGAEATRALAAEALLAPKANPTFTGTVTVPTTVGATDAAQKAYVDSVASGLNAKPSVKAAATGSVTLSGTQTIDGVAVAGGDRVLATGQGTGSQNGVWTVASGAWTRPADFASGSSQSGTYVFVEGGTANGSSGWVLTGTAAVTVDTTAQTWTQFSGAGEITAGTGLSKAGNTLSVALPQLDSRYISVKTIAWDIVHDFGADPTGAASSATAMSNAITALAAAAVYGGSAQGYGGSGTPTGSTPLLTAPPGAYMIDSTVALPSYMRMVMPGAIFFDTTGTVDLFTTTGYETVISGLRCRGGRRHIYVQTSNINEVVLRIDDCALDGASAACIETDGGSRSTNMILSRLRVTTAGSGTRALKLGSGDHVQWNGGWLDGNTDYFIEMTAGALWLTDVLGVPGSGAGAWVLVNANANPAFWSILVIDKFRFGGENPKTLVEWHAAPSSTNPTHLSIRGGSQVFAAGKPLAHFYDLPNVTDLANLEGMTGGGWLFTFDSGIPVASKQLIGQEAAAGAGVMIQADRTTDKLLPFTNASDPDTVAAVIAQVRP